MYVRVCVCVRVYMLMCVCVCVCVRVFVCAGACMCACVSACVCVCVYSCMQTLTPVWVARFPHRNWLGRKRDRLPVSKWLFVYNTAIDDRAHSDDVHALMTCTLSHPYPKYSSTECYRAPILPRVLPPNLYMKQCITSCTHPTSCTHSHTLILLSTHIL